MPYTAKYLKNKTYTLIGYPVYDFIQTARERAYEYVNFEYKVGKKSYAKAYIFHLSNNGLVEKAIGIVECNYGAYTYTDLITSKTYPLYSSGRIGQY